MKPLTYQGRVIVGRCRNCRLVIWGKPEDGERDEHGYCGVTTSQSDPDQLDQEAS